MIWSICTWDAADAQLTRHMHVLHSGSYPQKRTFADSDVVIACTMNPTKLKACCVSQLLGYLPVYQIVLPSLGCALWARAEAQLQQAPQGKATPPERPCLSHSCLLWRMSLLAGLPQAVLLAAAAAAAWECLSPGLS